MPIKKTVINHLPAVWATCNRCNHTWLIRKKTLPKNCPNCNSPYWNKNRIRNKN